MLTSNNKSNCVDNCIIFNSYNCILNLFSGVVDNDKIENYVEQREKYASKWENQCFKNAVKQMDEYMSDRIVCYDTLIPN